MNTVEWLVFYLLFYSIDIVILPFDMQYNLQYNDIYYFTECGTMKAVVDREFYVDLYDENSLRTNLIGFLFMTLCAPNNKVYSVDCHLLSSV